LPSSCGAEADALLGARAVSGVREHHVAREHELDGAIELARGHGAQRGVRPGEELAAEAGADEARDDVDVFLGDAEDLRHDVLRWLTTPWEVS
jgi:hypothetical protein